MTYGFNMLYGFKTQLNVTLPVEMYKAVVTNCGSLTKLIKVVKCLLKMLCRTPKYKGNNTVQLTAAAFSAIVKSSQSYFPPDLKNKTKVNDVICIAPRLTQPDAEWLFGTTNPPIISAKHSYLVNLLGGIQS